MATQSARERVLHGEPSAVYALDEAKAARLKGRTMLIPSPVQVRDAIARIPAGKSKTLGQLRTEMADEAGAEITCPYAARVHWLLVAEAAEEDRAEGADPVTPWWRVTRDGEAYSKVPGGEDNHRALLAAEGIRI